jgi:glycerol-3-phosphate acyltransferase PlsY
VDVTLQVVLGAVIGYAFGMLPTGMIVGRSLGVDLTKVGSGRTGATNALRTLGARWAAVVALGDILKGLVPVLIDGWATGGVPFWGLPTVAQVAAASFAIVGHTFSPLIGFRGGRGVLTGGGGLLLLSWPAVVLALACGVVAIVLTKYVSLGSLVGAVVAGTVVVVQALLGYAPLAYVPYGILMSAFVIVAHRDNIQRLLNGTERKLSRGSARAE